MENIDVDNFSQFMGPCNIAVVGPTLAGKSRLIFKILSRLSVLFTTDNVPKEVLYCYGVYQPLYTEMADEIPNFTLHEGLPTRNEILQFADGHQDRILVMDDLANKLVQSESILELVTQHMHHRRLSTIIVTQNLYMQGKYARTISLNLQYIILFKNLRDTTQVSFLGRQLFVGHNRLIEAYHDATKEKNGYILIDLSPQQVDDNLRLRSHIVDGLCIIYYPR